MSISICLRSQALSNIAKTWDQCIRCTSQASKAFRLSEEVQTAFTQGAPVVALESTIVAHGMPSPDNLSCASKVQNIVRRKGATPATVAIIGGKVHIGLENHELETLANSEADFAKASRRDLPVIIGKGKNAATTVSGTALLAHRAGIDVFVTGGIGGVHRQGEDTLDESADLFELSRTPVCVVCAGAKSILDIPRTLERLESLGVTVVGYQTDFFPSFFSRSSGCRVPHRVDTAEEAAKIMHAKMKLGLKSGMIVAVPIPEEFAIDGDTMNNVIQQALEEAQTLNIFGKDVTPFLLSKINNITGGGSLAANKRLIENNAAIGAAISMHLGELGKSHRISCSTGESSVVVLGGLVMDTLATPLPESDKDFVQGTSNPGIVKQSAGGVAKNIVESYVKTANTADNILFITPVGQDLAGEVLKDHVQKMGINSAGIITLDHRSPQYVAVHGHRGALLHGVADMKIIESLGWCEVSKHFEQDLREATIIASDANLNVTFLRQLATFCRKHNKKFWFEPTSDIKAIKCVDADMLDALTYMSPNKSELVAIVNRMQKTVDPHCGNQQLVEILLDAGVEHVFLKLGPDGLLHGQKEPRSFTNYPAVQIPKVVNTNGAGDAFVGATLASLLKGETINSSIQLGMRYRPLDLFKKLFAGLNAASLAIRQHTEAE
eukprot:m.140278 g.140278  ORF g.140278 m.140278 type:complete len:666 (+) comp14822_c0_seq3:251-2248(+)